MTRDEAMCALETLAASPAAGWIGNKFIDGGSKLLQKCMRCGAEQLFDMPPSTVAAFQSGARGDTLARKVPPDFDGKLFAFKRAFQIAHEGCLDDVVPRN
jgi:hypothetical protein